MSNAQPSLLSAKPTRTSTYRFSQAAVCRSTL